MTTSSGLQLWLRALRPSDADRLEDGFDNLSAESRYLRFFTPMHDLDERMIDRFVSPDQRDHVAIGALDSLGVVGEGLGVARAFRSSDDPTEAEFAVVVIDDHHGKGIGSLLLDALGAACARVDIETLTSDVLSTNSSMLALVARRGGTSRHVPGDASVTKATIPVSALASRLSAADRQRITDHLDDETRYLPAVTNGCVGRLAHGEPSAPPCASGSGTVGLPAG